MSSLTSLGWNHFVRNNPISSLGASGALKAAVSIISQFKPLNRLDIRNYELFRLSPSARQVCHLWHNTHSSLGLRPSSAPI